MTKPKPESQLIEHLCHYVAPTYTKGSTSVWHRVPISRRSAVFILLFLGTMGELRVLLTKRSSKLRNFPGHVALPGGKADNGLESEWQVSRREMHEEIGLSSNDADLKKLGVSIEHIALMPSYLSRTFSCVRPCVGFMRFTNGGGNNGELEALKLSLALNPGESSSMFSCPLRDFLYPTSEEPPREALERMSYKIKWGGIPWNLRSYTFLQINDNEVDWLKHIKDLSASEDEELGDELDSEDKESITPPGIKTRSTSPAPAHAPVGEPKSPKQNAKRRRNLSSWGRLGSRRHEDSNEKIYDVWGLTANILHDLSQLVYLHDQPLKSEIGEEELIYAIHDFGHLMRQKERSDIEKKLIHSTSMDDAEAGFKNLLPKEEFERLHSIYKL
ncbi:uncharacterized protein LODBEIA_P19200 [Lodderomyces beijingensis]|uniref:Nudix hydrolase domain-containing protein n=1 Tax=Lodderomyces beijingensis TaxID=1775926 RepID=A0ABP0ZLC9_9ASCO